MSSGFPGRKRYLVAEPADLCYRCTTVGNDHVALAQAGLGRGRVVTDLRYKNSSSGFYYSGVRI